MAAAFQRSFYRGSHPSFRRSTLYVVLMSVIYAIIGNTFFHMAYRSSAVIDQSYLIVAVLAVLYVIPVVLWFRSRYWYFPLFIPILWVPMTVISSFLFGILFPLPEEDMGGGLLLLFIHGLNLGSVLLGVALGMTANGLITAWRKFGSEIQAK